MTILFSQNFVIQLSKELSYFSVCLNFITVIKELLFS